MIAAIQAEGPRTRGQLRQHLLDAGLPAAGPALTVITSSAEALALICSGPRANDEHTHALVTERAPNARRLDRDEALAELALRYLSGHGPATDRDLAYWATLTLTDARAGITSVSHQLASLEHDGRCYWYRRDTEPANLARSAHLLQILDEIYRGYQDSRWVLDTNHLVDRRREPATAMALVDGQIAATMTRRLTTDTVEFILDPYRPINAEEATALSEVAERYGAFLGRRARVTFRQSSAVSGQGYSFPTSS